MLDAKCPAPKNDITTMQPHISLEVHTGVVQPQSHVPGLPEIRAQLTSMTSFSVYRSVMPNHCIHFSRHIKCRMHSP